METITPLFTSTWFGRELLSVWMKKMATRKERRAPQKRVITWPDSECSNVQETHESEVSADEFSLSCSDNEYDYHEKVVDDINMRFFYQPRTLTLLCFIIALLIFFALARDDSNSRESNILAGLLCVCFWFVPVSLLCFPNGPFVRPHPAVWRIVCGACFAYQLLLSFSLFQTYEDVRGVFVYLYPELKSNFSDSEVDYASDCRLTYNNVWSRIDFFIIAHLLGYVVKAMLLRHAGMVWFISIMWEITEMAFMHLLPNFAECWWDIVFMDVLLCNGVGIHLGIYFCHKLEMKTFKWASIKDIRSAHGKIRRIIMQFTPVSWTKVRWTECSSPFSRFCAILVLIFLFQIIELNIFFFKHIFVIPSNHSLLMFHHALLVLSSAPSLRQYYLYVTDCNRERIGTQFWFFIAFVLTETLFILKFGKDLFRQISISYVVAWIIIQVGLSMLAVFLIVYMAKPSLGLQQKTKFRRSSTSRSSAGNHITEQLKAHESSADESDCEQSKKSPTTAVRSRMHHQI